MPTPHGEIAVSYRREGERLSAEVTLPEGLTGAFVWKGRVHELRAGREVLELAADGGRRSQLALAPAQGLAGIVEGWELKRGGSLRVAASIPERVASSVS
jgi:hypothetical protein